MEPRFGDRFVIGWLAAKAEYLMNDRMADANRQAILEALIEDLKLAADGRKVRHLQELDASHG